MRIIGDISAPKLSIEYNSADYTDNLIARLAESFNIVLKQFIQQNNQPVRKISLLDDNSKQILVKFRSNTNPTTINKVYHYFHEGFEEQAVKNPDKIALLLPRTSRTILSIFGVLKAGCAYIPCDTEYPAERINQILEDSNAPYVITTADKIFRVRR